MGVLQHVVSFVPSVLASCRFVGPLYPVVCYLKSEVSCYGNSYSVAKFSRVFPIDNYKCSRIFWLFGCLGNEIGAKFCCKKSETTSMIKA